MCYIQLQSLYRVWLTSSRWLLCPYTSSSCFSAHITPQLRPVTRANEDTTVTRCSFGVVWFGRSAEEAYWELSRAIKCAMLDTDCNDLDVDTLGAGISFTLEPEAAKSRHVSRHPLSDLSNSLASFSRANTSTLNYPCLSVLSVSSGPRFASWLGSWGCSHLPFLTFTVGRMAGCGISPCPRITG